MIKVIKKDTVGKFITKIILKRSPKNTKGRTIGKYAHSSTNYVHFCLLRLKVLTVIPMMTPSNGDIFRVTGYLCGEFTGHRWIPRTRPVTRSFDVFFDLRLYKRLIKQSWGWWFETPSRSSWRHSNGYVWNKMLWTKILGHYNDIIMGTMASQITSLTIIYSTVYSDADQRKHQSSASLAFVWGIHRGPVNSPHRWPVTRKIFPFDDVIMVALPACVIELG